MNFASLHEKLTKPLSPSGIVILFIGLLYLKFLIFDFIWALDTTFSGFQFWEGYFTKLILSVILALPLLWIRRKWYIITICFIVDAWLVANLMYFRSYYTVIPISSYLLIGNLSDFQSSVWESLRYSDILFPLSTILLILRLKSARVCNIMNGDTKRLRIRLILTGTAPLAILAVYIIFRGGYKAEYEYLLYDYSTCGAAVYSIPGTWIYETMAGETVLSPELEQRIDTWLDNNKNLFPADSVPDIRSKVRDNCIIILAESLESWVIDAVVSGIEITPSLNRLVKESDVLYAPNMLTQVKGSRSIDAQLLIHTGLLPVNYGSYAYRFPHHSYMSLDKAFKERYSDGLTMSFTVDKKVVWNAAIVAQDFGYDYLLDKPYFVLDEKTGPRNRLGDHSFLRQSAEKLETEELFKTGGHTLVQLVTYSGHTPFVLSDDLKDIHLPDSIPERLRNYMEVANYTDKAIGEFVARIRSNPKFANTMIVITGDHEGIGISRKDLVKNPSIARYLSPEQFTPFIVLNSPVEMRYDGVFGQVDMYPTLLDLLGFDDYGWRGLGHSLLNPAKLPFAISPQNEVVASDTVPADILYHSRQAYEISDLMISCDYFMNK